MATAAATFGSGFSTPFIALFLSQDFGVRPAARLAVLTGVLIAGPQFVVFLTSPIMGMIGDRYGRRLIVVTTMGLAGVAIIGTGLAPNVVVLLLLRLMAGLGGGISGPSMALVASGTPRDRLGKAFGILGAARAAGQAIGPLVGALLATVLALRIVFVASGGTFVLGLIPVALLARDVPNSRPRTGTTSLGARWRLTSRAVRSQLQMLGLCTAFAFFAFVGAQQMVSLRILVLEPARPAVATGVAFAALGLSAALASITHSRFIERVGYKRLVITGSLLLCAGILGIALLSNIEAVVVSALLTGMGFGVVSPAVNSMIGLDTPVEIRATLFGFAVSLGFLGAGLGPLSAGLVAAFAGTSTALYLLAAVASLVAVVVQFWVREPQIQMD